MLRYDSAPINKLTVDAQTGFLIAKDVPICRVGVFPYRSSDGQVHYEAKLPEEILSDSTIESANGKPITDDHPANGTLVDSHNVNELGKGFTATNAHQDGDRIKVDMIVTDSDLIQKVKDGKQELSIGFATKLDGQSGTYNGMRYDTAQRNIVINHVAIVQRGRAGHGISIVGDSAEQIPFEDQRKDDSMEYTKVRLDGADITVAMDDAEKVTKANNELAEKRAKGTDLDKENASLKSENEKLKAELKKAKGDADSAKKEADTAKAKADSADDENSKLKERLDSLDIDAMVEDRLKLRKEASVFLGDSYDFKGKDAQEIKRDAIKAVRGDDFDLDNKSNDYVDAYFDGLKDTATNKIVGFNGSRNDSAEDNTNDLLNARYNLYKGGSK